MAKKKKAAKDNSSNTSNEKLSLAERLKNLDKISAEISEKNPSILMGRVNTTLIQNKLKGKFIPTASLELNQMIGGGFPKGKLTILAGNEDSGKTSLVLETIGLAMQENPEFIALWLETENSLSETMLKMFNVDMERFYLIDISKKGGAEASLTAFDSMLACNANIDIAVINSLKGLTPSEELINDFASMQVGLAARLNSKMTRKFLPIISEKEIALVVTQHFTTKIGGLPFGNPYEMAGGLSIRYNSALIIEMRKVMLDQKSDIYTKEEAVKISVIIKKNHIVVDKFPYGTFQYYAVFGKGIDRKFELINAAEKQGVLEKRGAFYNLLDENTGETLIDETGFKYQWQGRKNLYKYIDEHPEFYNKLLNSISFVSDDVDIEEIHDLPDIPDEAIEAILNINNDDIAN